MEESLDLRDNRRPNDAAQELVERHEAPYPLSDLEVQLPQARALTSGLCSQAQQGPVNVRSRSVIQEVQPSYIPLTWMQM